jgi:WD40 repeat protein
MPPIRPYSLTRRGPRSIRSRGAVIPASGPIYRHRLPGLTGHTDAVRSAAFASDGHTLATGSDDSTVILWDVRDPARPQRLGPPLTGHTGAVGSVAFASDGHTLATGSYDNSVISWDLASLFFVRDHAARIACTLTGGGINPDEWNRSSGSLSDEDSCSTS